VLPPLFVFVLCLSLISRDRHTENRFAGVVLKVAVFAKHPVVLSVLDDLTVGKFVSSAKKQSVMDIGS
jgi:hypothetical protein